MYRICFGILKVIHRDHDSAIYAISAHPFKSHLATASYSGLIKVWDYDSKMTVVSRRFDHHLKVRTIQYDPRGEFMGEKNTIFMVLKSHLISTTECCNILWIFSGWIHKRSLESDRCDVIGGSALPKLPVFP